MIYDTETDSWSEGTSGPTIVVVGAAGATTGVNALQKGLCFRVGMGDFLRRLLIKFTILRLTLGRQLTAMPTLRIDFGVAVVNDILYAIGGYSYDVTKYMVL